MLRSTTTSATTSATMVASAFRQFALALALVTCLAIDTSAQTPANPWGAGNGARATGKYADVNGIRLYYEIHGKGQPLVLLHGGLGAGSMFGSNLTALARGRQVILMDLQGHGRTADVDRPIRIETMADDVAALLAHLGIRQADVMGYSLGGGVALQTAIRHPAAVRRLVIASAAVRSNAYYPELRAQQVAVGGAMADQMKGTPMWELYQAVAPRKQDFPRLLDKLGTLMRTEYDLSSQLAGVKTPMLIVAADADMFPPSHAVEVFGLLGGGKRDGGWDGSGRPKTAQLAILPGRTHYDLFSAPALAEVAIRFLDEK